MSIATLILGESGSGKSFSMLELDPANTLLIQAVKKPLSFRAPTWGYLTNSNPKGNILVRDNTDEIMTVLLIFTTIQLLYKIGVPKKQIIMIFR